MEWQPADWVEFHSEAHVHAYISDTEGNKYVLKVPTCARVDGVIIYDIRKEAPPAEVVSDEN